MTNYMFNRL